MHQVSGISTFLLAGDSERKVRMCTYENDTHQSPSQERFKKVALRIGRSWSGHETRVETERLLMASYSRTVQSVRNDATSIAWIR